MGVLSRLREEGKIDHIGLSDVSVEEIERARTVVEIATVQNELNLANGKHDAVLAYCERNAIGFICFYPQMLGALGEAAILKAIADREAVTPALVAMAWLLKRSPATIIIPGTSSLAHLEENIGAANVRLSPEDMTRLDRLTSTANEFA